MDETLIPRELYCDILRERAVLIGMDACSRLIELPAEVTRVINSTDDELLQRHESAIHTYDELDAWSDRIIDKAKGLSV